MRAKLTPEAWLKKLTQKEIEWLTSHLVKTKQLRSKLYSSTQDQLEHLLDRLNRAFEHEKLFEKCRSSIRQKRSRDRVRKHSYVFRLTPEEFQKLQTLAKSHATNRTEIIRRLIHADLSPLKEAQRIEDSNRRAQRDLALKRDDMKKLADYAISLAANLAEQLAEARVDALCQHELKPELLETRNKLISSEALQLKQQIENNIQRKKRELNKKLHNLPGSIARPQKIKQA